MTARSGTRRAEPRGSHAVPPLAMNSVWVEGPRTEAWNELWRRLLAIAFAECGCHDREAADSIEGNAHDQVETAAPASEVQ